MVMKVMTNTTSTVEVTLAVPSDKPQPSRTAAKSSLYAASPTMPLSMPIEVMPTCTEDKNWVGLSIRLSAVWAPRSPLSASASRRALRLEAKASSDMAKAPLSRIKNRISRASIIAVYA